MIYEENTATIINGKAIAHELREQLTHDIVTLTQDGKHPTPELAVILVGNDEGSQIYVANKIKACEHVGIKSIVHRLPEDTPEATVIELIEELNNTSSVNGILVQLPLPEHISSRTVINAINPTKDVDGLTYINAGHMLVGDKMGIAPCTPLGCMHLLKSFMPLSDYAGMNAVVIGRSNLVGKPMAQLLLGLDCTVTQCHSKTRNIADIVKQADIVVAAIGKPHFVKAEWLKQHAIVLDVGISRIVDDETGQRRLCGDVEFDQALDVVQAITPVPGGVGPMTIASLLRNTFTAYKKQNNIDYKESSCSHAVCCHR